MWDKELKGILIDDALKSMTLNNLEVEHIKLRQHCDLFFMNTRVMTMQELRGTFTPPLKIRRFHDACAFLNITYHDNMLLESCALPILRSFSILVLGMYTGVRSTLCMESMNAENLSPIGI